jgi:hypothetical protein
MSDTDPLVRVALHNGHALDDDRRGPGIVVARMSEVRHLVALRMATIIERISEPESKTSPEVLTEPESGPAEAPAPPAPSQPEIAGMP